MKAAIFRWALEVGRRALPRAPRGEAPVARARRAARRRRSARLPEGPRALRRAAPLLRVGLRAALEGRRRVLRRHGRRHPRGLRAHRVVRCDAREPAVLAQARHRRAGAAGSRGEDRRGRRDPDARRRGSCARYRGLPEETAEALDAEGFLHTGDMGHARRGRLPHHHRPQEGPHQDVRRQVRRADRHRGAAEGALARDLAGARARRSAQLHHRARDPRRPGDLPLGVGERARRRGGPTRSRARRR